MWEIKWRRRDGRDVSLTTLSKRAWRVQLLFSLVCQKSIRGLLYVSTNNNAINAHWNLSQLFWNVIDWYIVCLLSQWTLNNMNMNHMRFLMITDVKNYRYKASKGLHIYLNHMEISVCLPIILCTNTFCFTHTVPRWKWYEVVLSVLFVKSVSNVIINKLFKRRCRKWNHVNVSGFKLCFQLDIFKTSL